MHPELQQGAFQHTAGCLLPPRLQASELVSAGRLKTREGGYGRFTKSPVLYVGSTAPHNILRLIPWTQVTPSLSRCSLIRLSKRVTCAALSVWLLSVIGYQEEACKSLPGAGDAVECRYNTRDHGNGTTNQKYLFNHYFVYATEVSVYVPPPGSSPTPDFLRTHCRRLSLAYFPYCVLASRSFFMTLGSPVPWSKYWSFSMRADTISGQAVTLYIHERTFSYVTLADFRQFLESRENKIRLKWGSL